MYAVYAYSLTYKWLYGYTQQTRTDVNETVVLRCTLCTRLSRFSNIIFYGRQPPPPHRNVTETKYISNKKITKYVFPLFAEYYTRNEPQFKVVCDNSVTQIVRKYRYLRKTYRNNTDTIPFALTIVLNLQWLYNF